MAIDQRRHEVKHKHLIRDIRPLYQRIADSLKEPANSATVFMLGAGAIYFVPAVASLTDIVIVLYILFFFWLKTRDRRIVFKLPMGSKWKDPNNEGPGRSGKAEGILYLGNHKNTQEEVWFTNSDARTHVLYLGTTGAGKTEGLKSMVTNALGWGSGFVYVDGKADTDLWSSLSSLCRRFGRDDDLLVLNYMTGNSDTRAPSNTMNPFSSGSASYLTQMLVSLMPDAEGDNAMWKERAVSLISSLMPALTWKRQYQEMPLSVSTIRSHLNLDKIIKLSRDEAIPYKIREGLLGYLDTLPGYIANAFDDEGKEKPMGPDQPMVDTTTVRQQHGYLSMQFTRSLQSLGDEYGYIFDTQAADVDMVDVVLNRRILVVLIPALEKSGDEIANLGKIVAATLKGMMGSTLGSTVEGESSKVIENKPTHSSTPFMTVFDEVGYYTAQGMAVMAAQARSLGFCLVFSGQDLPAMKKRVKEEANSITANCNIKIFGKLEDPTETKDFFEKTVGTSFVTEVQSFQISGGMSTGSYYDTKSAGVQNRAKASYDELRSYKEGQAIVTFGDQVMETNIFYCNPGHAKALRVTRFLFLPPPDDTMLKHAGTITKLRDLMVHKSWTASKAEVAAEEIPEITALAEGFKLGKSAKADPVDCGITAVIGVHALFNPIDLNASDAADGAGGEAGGGPAPVAAPAQITIPGAPAAAPAVTPQLFKPPAGQPPQTEAASAAGAPPSGNPMSFFGKKDEQAAPPPPPIQVEDSGAPADTPPKKPMTWDQLINEAENDGAKTAAAAPPATAVLSAAPASALPPEAENILREAGNSLNRTLFSKDKADAAE